MSDDLPIFQCRITKLLDVMSGFYPTWDMALAEKLLEFFELDRNAQSGDLSSGEGAHLRLVLAMAFRPRLLVLDEPAAGLDLARRRTLFRLILELVKDDVSSVLISSHHLHDLERLADDLLVLADGQVIAAGAMHELVGDESTLEDAWEGWGLAR
jgi:ABC-2 type transport system ATP-binding protein